MYDILDDIFDNDGSSAEKIKIKKLHKRLYDQQYRKINKNKKNSGQRRWRLNNIDKEKDKQLRYKYNITLDMKKSMYAYQNGKCGGCGEAKELNELQIDHCNETLILRGLLCYSCNRGLGSLKHSTRILLGCLQYLNNVPAQKLFYGHKIPKRMLSMKEKGYKLVHKKVLV